MMQAETWRIELSALPDANADAIDVVAQGLVLDLLQNLDIKSIRQRQVFEFPANGLGRQAVIHTFERQIHVRTGYGIALGP